MTSALDDNKSQPRNGQTQSALSADDEFLFKAGTEAIKKHKEDLRPREAEKNKTQ